MPQSKPIWFTEAGCPAIDKGANQPNVFVDAKSSESALPYYSNGARDDVMQSRCVSVLDDYWSASGAHNPLSSIYGGPMVDASRIFFWCWDARPFPYFPALTDVWSDGGNYPRGHWLNGRLTSVLIDRLIRDVCGLYGMPTIAVEGVHEAVEGFVIDRPMTGRAALESLLQAFALDAVESEGGLKFISRLTNVELAVAVDEQVEVDAEQPLAVLTRTQETDLPAALKLVYADAATDYRNAVAAAHRQTGLSGRETILELPCATTQATAQCRAAILAGGKLVWPRAGEFFTSAFIVAARTRRCAQPRWAPPAHRTDQRWRFQKSRGVGA